MNCSVIREALKHAEVKQQAQLQIALAADARAMTLCVACAGFSGVLVGITATTKAQDALIPLSMMAFCLFLAAWAARPIAFAAPGQDFETFKQDIAEQRELDAVLMELGNHLDADSADNEKRAKKSARFILASMLTAAASPLVGLLVRLVQ